METDTDENVSKAMTVMKNAAPSQRKVEDKFEIWINSERIFRFWMDFLIKNCQRSTLEQFDFVLIRLCV